MVATTVIDRLRAEFDDPPARLAAIASLLIEEGATVAFVTRYRKERTGGMEETRIREIRDRLVVLCELEERKNVIRQAARDGGKLTDELEAKVAACFDRTRLEDLYLPFRPRRRTKAAIAIEQGLGAIADAVRARTLGEKKLADLAAEHVSEEKGLPTPEAVLEGVLEILSEEMSEDADLRHRLRTELARGLIRAKVLDPDRRGAGKYSDYFDFREPVRKIPAHRMLAIRRAEREEILAVNLEIPEDQALAVMKERFAADLTDPEAELTQFMNRVLIDAYQKHLLPFCEADVRRDMKERADRESIRIFGENLRSMLLAPPMPGVAVLGIDPAPRRGMRLAAVDAQGQFLEAALVSPEKAETLEEAKTKTLAMLKTHGIGAIAIGNGPGSREADGFMRALLAAEGPDRPDPSPRIVIVDEAGAAIYASSPQARKEFGNQDMGTRAAISIARRLQDPLAELVKVDPRLLGVGQYQHDVHQGTLTRGLEAVVESCVDHVGAEVNSASADLLAHLSGLNRDVARSIADRRQASGPLRSRADLAAVRGMGPRELQQSGGFLRIKGTDEPLDATGIHPERYDLVRAMATSVGLEVKDLLGNKEAIDKLDLTKFAGEDVGTVTLQDIVHELEKPGRDPRTTFKAAAFREDVKDLKDLKPGMELEGRVTNVTEFGAFVDIGIHQDGLIHVSQISDQFVKVVTDVIKVGDVVKVRVIEVDPVRRRISLTMRPPTRDAEDVRDRRPTTIGEIMERKERQARGGRGRERERDQRPPPPGTVWPPPPGEAAAVAAAAAAAAAGGGEAPRQRDRGRAPFAPRPVAQTRAARPPETRRGTTRRPPKAPDGNRETVFGDMRGGGGGDRRGGSGGRSGDRGRGGDGPPRVYTIDSEKQGQESRGHKGELKSLSSLRALFGGAAAEPQGEQGEGDQGAAQPGEPMEQQGQAEGTPVPPPPPSTSASSPSAP